MADPFGIEEAANGIKASIKAGKSLQDSMGQLIAFAEQTDKAKYQATIRGKKSTAAYDAQLAAKEFVERRKLQELEKAIKDELTRQYGKSAVEEYEHIVADIKVRRRKADNAARNEKIFGKVMLWAGIAFGIFVCWYVGFRL